MYVYYWKTWGKQLGGASEGFSIPEFPCRIPASTIVPRLHGFGHVAGGVGRPTADESVC